MLRVGHEPGVVHPFDTRMLGQKVGDYPPVSIMSLHAYRQCLSPAKHKKRVERREYRPDAVLDEPDPLSILFIVQSHEAANAIGVSVQVFRGRMDNNVYAVICRLLKVRGHESVVADDLCTVGMREI